MVNFRLISEEIVSTADKLENLFHQVYTPSCGMTSDEEYLAEEEEGTGISPPELIKKILLEYGSHQLNFRILDKENSGRYIFGRGNIWAIYAFDWGGFDKISTYRDNKEYYVQIPLEGSLLLEDLSFGKYIVVKQRENAENIEDVDLYLFEYPNQFNKLRVSLEQYFSLLPKTFGMYCWQEYLTEDSYPLNGEIPDLFHENMKKLFPEVDLSIFREPPKLRKSVYNTFISKPDKVDYRAMFLDVIRLLENNPNVEFRYYKRTNGFIIDETQYTARYGVTEDVLRKIKKDYGREISEQMLAFYYTMNGCSVDWVYTNDADQDVYIEGQINFLPLEETMGGKWNQQYLDWASPDLFKDEDAVYSFNKEEAAEYPRLAKLMKRARLFDEQGETRDYFIEFVKGQSEPNIYKVNQTDFYKMDIDFKTFIEARIQFAGISGWEYRYFNDPDYSENDIERFIKNFKEKVALILPDAPFEKFGL
ncbi:MAG: hypothetical protein ABUK01_19220 [Leptospirales bacterium]